MRWFKRFLRAPAILAGLCMLVLCLILNNKSPPYLKSIAQRIADLPLSYTARPPRADAVVIVDIDEASLREYGQWPWSRSFLARLVAQIQRQGAKVLALDMTFPERDRTSPAVVLEEWKRDYGPQVRVEGIPLDQSDYDSQLAAALARSPSVIGCFLPEDLGAPLPKNYRSYFYERGARPTNNVIPFAKGIVFAMPAYYGTNTTLAFFNKDADLDGVVRRTPLVYILAPDTLLPSLSLEAVRLFLGGGNCGVYYDLEGYPGVSYLQLRNLRVATNPGGSLLLNWRSTHFPRISVRDVMKNKPTANRIKGKIVLLGTTAMGLHDRSATPLDPEMPGVEIHATAIDNMLAGDMLLAPVWKREADQLIILMFGLIIIATLHRVRAWVGLAFVITLLYVVFYGSIWIASQWRLVTASGEMALMIVAVYTAMTVVKYWSEERGRTHMRNVFGFMVSRQVLQHIEEHPENLKLGGSKVEATIFVSDISNFSTMSEQLAPDVLVRLINNYMTPMSDIILRHNGYLDKFDGDAIMAVWGVPIHAPNHELQACQAACEQAECLRALGKPLKAEFNVELAIRIGINTGLVTAGNMGSSQRFQYTVMGDAVNQSFRFGDWARYYRTMTLIGHHTYQAVNARMLCRYLDRVSIKGKAHPVPIYELMGPMQDRALALNDAVRFYEAAIEAANNKEWKTALAHLEKLLAQYPADGPGLVLKKRVVHAQRTGVFLDAMAIASIDMS